MPEKICGTVHYKFAKKMNGVQFAFVSSKLNDVPVQIHQLKNERLSVRVRSIKERRSLTYVRIM